MLLLKKKMSHDLYSDLIVSEHEQELEKLRQEILAEQERTRKVNAELEATKRELDESRKEINILKRNLSAIYHTAKKEIQRKDGMIAELRQQLSD